MKVIIKNSSGTLHGLGVITETGIIFLDNGEITHVTHEKDYQRSIVAYHEPEAEKTETKKKVNSKK